MCTRKRLFQSYKSKQHTERKYILSSWIGLVVISVLILTVCQAASVVESSSIESATIVQPTTVPTRVPTTEVPTLAPSDTPVPTETPTMTPTPKPQLGPEELATSIENVAGKWAFRVMGGGEGDDAIFTLSAEGTHSIDAVSGYHAGMNLGTGKYWFEDNVIVMYSEECDGFSDIFTCKAYYKIYFAMGENGVGSLRFVAIDDPHKDRKKS